MGLDFEGGVEFQETFQDGGGCLNEATESVTGLEYLLDVVTLHFRPGLLN